ncbi:uncharacterized protein THITE_2121909 [Thermothielavioides terrestris NRRL 8126]|uniref:Uncharacterized protein n=1 Tax=Thermothielavioides terrestris (strain ATCC 38088 / NRRL 8126) TaxID=578455 RepID=G2RFG7_THETT|nr:uncharacterized protein THITE_2121909 [Thermothielavioides terrestris NRRL 8126]AEO70450.1 hypothetical protein THITE_2121909 [Thermothielavioides terrestris NRRL 8126]
MPLRGCLLFFPLFSLYEYGSHVQRIEKGIGVIHHWSMPAQYLTQLLNDESSFSSAI